ncbi:hypothetical protein L1987_33738 [Smallanthus sonchifolius]|uniref:Uncharacterized protein n=1 Tax=Smallanthus sonchifolius TaxID=185202 RepID=A0ACB9HTB9_9ASTR|nr:hypothetical protein L1987_33738 [Smallanthus sonchifolius]
MAKKLYVVEGPVPNEPENNTAAARRAWDKHNEDAIEVACLMQATMCSDLRKNMEDIDGYDMIVQLKGMFQTQARQERYDTMKKLIACRMQEGTFVSAHVFVMNFNMNGWVKTVPEIHGMLKTAEMNVQSNTNQILMVRSGGVTKPKPKKRVNNSKVKKKVNVVAKPATNNKQVAKPKPPPPEERQCFECNKMGHWKRNCSEYLAKLRSKRANGEGTSSGISIYEPEKWKKLKQGDMELIVGDGKRVPVLAAGTFHLSCPSGLIVILDNCLLGHISKAHMKRLQSKGILESTGQDSFEDYKSCLAGKLTKGSFTGIGERAKDLLGLIQTDVCGPFLNYV